MKMPHGLQEPLAKNAVLHCGSAPFFSHTCWKLDALLCNQNMQSIIAICRVRAGHDWTSNPKHKKQHSFQILHRHQNSRHQNSRNIKTSETSKTPDTPDCWLLLVVLACGIFSKDSNADSDYFLLPNVGSNHTVLHSLRDLLFPQLKKVEVTPMTPLIPEGAPRPLHGKDLRAIGIVHGNCRCHRPVPGLQE